jgi:hypothetical protein
LARETDQRLSSILTDCVDGFLDAKRHLPDSDLR